jgi:hypothetical protein
MKYKNLLSLAIIIFGLSFVMATSLLLDWTFIQKHLFREIIIYILMIIELLVFYRMLLNLNKE